MTQRSSDIDVSRRRLRFFFAHRAIALGWTLKSCCKPCAHRLFTTARWLVPEAQRYLVYRTGSHNHNRRIFDFAVDLGGLLSRIQPLGVMGGFVIVLVLLGSLNLAPSTPKADTQPTLENSAFQHEPQNGSEILVSKSSEAAQGSLFETGSISGTQIAPVPLPSRKPERISKVLNGKAAKANPATRKRMAQQKSAQPKPTR